MFTNIRKAFISDLEEGSNSSLSFQGYLNKEKLELSRFMYILSAILFMVFSIVDYIAIPHLADDTLILRLSVSAYLMVIFLSTFRLSAHFIKYYRFITALSFILTSCSIQYIINLSTPADATHTIYFAGLMLIIISLYAWTFLNLTDAAIITSSILAIYIVSAIHISTSAYMETLANHLGNILFLASSAVIGMTSYLIRNRYLLQSYLLQDSLKNALDKKSIEARDNEYLANHDPLTDLPNRRYMTELLNNSLKEASEKKKVLVVMFIDLNGFKQVNDVYGHNAGDEVLVIVAKRLELAIRNGDHLSRLGGDEYLLGLMMEKESLGEIEAMANKFIHIISQPMNVEGLRVKIGASVGVAAYPIHGNNIEALMEIADKRMYQAKKRKPQADFFEDSTKYEKKESVVIFPGNVKTKKR